MILDRIEKLPLYEHVIPFAGKIAEAFAADNPANAPCEVREKEYAVKPDEKRRFEVYFHTIDLMIAKEGAEVIHICPMECVTPAEALAGGADGRKMDGGPCGTPAELHAGWFCAIFPGEAHMVGGKLHGEDGSISKWVVKVPCTAEFACNDKET